MLSAEDQEVALQLVKSQAQTRALKRHLQKSLSKIEQKEKEYLDILEIKNVDKSSSLYKSQSTRPKSRTANVCARSQVNHINYDTAEKSLYLYKQFTESLNTESVVVGEISLNSLRPVTRTSKVFPHPRLEIDHVIEPTVLPIGSPIAKSLEPYLRKTVGKKKASELNRRMEQEQMEMRQTMARKYFLQQDPPGITAQTLKVAVPFLEHPHFYVQSSPISRPNADGIREINHHKTFYCRR